MTWHSTPVSGEASSEVYVRCGEVDSDKVLEDAATEREPYKTGGAKPVPGPGACGESSSRPFIESRETRVTRVFS